MSSLKIFLPLLAVSSPLCNSFAPHHAPSSVVSRRASVLQATSDNNDDSTTNNKINNIFDNIDRRVGTVAGSALVALTLSFSSMNVPFGSTIQSANAAAPTSSILLAAKSKTVDDEVIKELESETRAVEKEAKIDAKKAKVEKSREAFFEYEAKMAEKQEERIEAAERKAEIEAEQDKIEAEKDKIEAEKDKIEAEKLKAAEKKAEKELAAAKTKEEKAAKLKEARVSQVFVCICNMHVYDMVLFVQTLYVCVYIHLNMNIIILSLLTKYHIQQNNNIHVCRHC